MVRLGELVYLIVPFVYSICFFGLDYLVGGRET